MKKRFFWKKKQVDGDFVNIGPNEDAALFPLSFHDSTC